jgi:cobalt-zinc-cadmium resistance protein CzcA
MLNAIIRFSIGNKLIIGLFILALVAGGSFAVSRLSIDALPDITSNQVQVITTSPSLAAPEVERLVTFPIEQACANIPGLTELRSFSRFGLSVVTIVFDDDIDMYLARQQVGERLTLVRDQVPAAANMPEMAPATTGLGEIFQYIVRPQKGYEGKYDLTELRSIQDWIIRRQLLGTPGVADVSSFGGRLKQYEVAIMTDKLKSLGITIQDVFEALQKNNENTGGAYIEKGPAALFIRTEGLATAKEDLEQIVVKHTAQGIPIFIRDVAVVQIGHAVRYGALTYKNEGEVAGAVVLMLKGENASAVIKAVKTRIEQIRKTLPEGIVLDVFYDRTKMVNNAIGTVKTNLLEGALIVVLVLVLFLGNWRAGFIVASVIPLSMLFAVLLMNLFGVSGNLMSLGALDFGLIVDGAVIIVEAVLHRLHQGKRFEHLHRLSQPQMDEEVEQSAGRMMNAAVFGQVIILIVYLPILTLVGIEGKMFRPMAQTVTFALLGAFILSVTYVPMISALLLSKKLKHTTTFSDRMMTVFQRWYRPVLQKALAFPKTVIAVTVILFAASLFILSRMGGEFIPELEEGDFAVDSRLLTGSSITQTIDAAAKAATILQQRFPEVEKIVTRIGASEIPTDPMPVEMGDIIILLKPRKQWTSAGSFDELANKMSQALEDVPGLKTGFQFPVQMRFNELISGARQDVVCKIFGENLDSLAMFAAHVGNIIHTVQGAHDLYVESVTGLPQIVVKYNRSALAHYRLNIADVNQVISTAFAGQSAGLVYENERRYDLVVRLQEEGRKDPADVENLLIPTPGGIQVPLYQVANVSIEEGPNQIQREDARRRIVVGFNVRGRDVQSIVQELNEKINRQAPLPAGYYLKYGGQFENLVQAKKRLSVAVPAALLLIFILLYFAFGKIKYGLLIFSAIPLSAIGGIVLLWLRGMPFSVSAGIGFIALFGVAVLNGIVLIAEFNRLRQQGSIDIKQIIMEGTSVRLRPVLMTAAVASLGFLPMALSQGAGAEVQRPLATVVIGGLITATLLTLIVLPVLYNWLVGRRSTKRPPPAVIALITGLLLTTGASAQTTGVRKMNLDQMLQQAHTQNMTLQVSRKQVDYWKQLQTSTVNLPRTQVGAEYGNINSMNNDTRFYINQSFGLPVVYRRQKALYKAEEMSAVAQNQWRQRELDKEIRTVYYSMVDLLERQRLLQRLDSVYGRFLEAAALRLKTGETDILEKSSAEAQVYQLRLQQQQVAADIRIDQQRLQWLLNTTDSLLPDYQQAKLQAAPADTTVLAQHPAVQYRQQQVAVQAAQTNVERSSLAPEFTIGYNNQSIIGYQTKDGVTQQYYGAGDRFNIYQLSVGIPLFNGAAKARIRAGKIHEEVAGMQAAVTARQLSNEVQLLIEEHKKYLEQVAYYEQTGLQQAALIAKNAKMGFEKGATSYVEWTLLMNNAVTIELGYLQAIHALNTTVIELDYLTGK